MQYCVNHPEEINKLSRVKAHLSEVKGIMMDNIEKVCAQLNIYNLGIACISLLTNKFCTNEALDSAFLYAHTFSVLFR
jgi:hypothetical protein